MGKPKASKIDVPDPLEIIEAEKMANRTGVVTPFGRSEWQGDDQVTTFGPQMDAMKDRMFNLGMQDSQRMEMPDFMGDLASAIGGRVGERYGMNPSSFGSVSKPQQEQKQPQQSTTPIGPEIGGQAQFNQPQAPPNPGYMPPGPPMDPGQLEQLRQRMSGGNNHFFNPRIK